MKDSLDKDEALKPSALHTTPPSERRGGGFFREGTEGHNSAEVVVGGVKRLGPTLRETRFKVLRSGGGQEKIRPRAGTLEKGCPEKEKCKENVDSSFVCHREF